MFAKESRWQLAFSCLRLLNGVFSLQGGPRVKAQAFPALQMAQLRWAVQVKMHFDALIGVRIKTIFDGVHGLCDAKRIDAGLNDDTGFGLTNHKWSV